MTEFSVCPEGGTWEEADRPTLSDAIHDARYALEQYRAGQATPVWIADMLDILIARAEEADDKLKEYRRPGTHA